MLDRRHTGVMMPRAPLVPWFVMAVSVALFSAACGGGGTESRPAAPTSRTADEQYLDAVRSIFGPRATRPLDDLGDATLLKLRETMCRRIRDNPERWDGMTWNMADVWGISQADSAQALRIIVRSGCPELIKHDPEPVI